ncbi:hypothetical protein F2Q68_00033711 [Brassica cretica]|uniref:Uncharacterized protein n=1 Tax=Brassica cretica TaxID=69181 RepID=A0A8S9H5Q9_BRACR|nr:hypothetical protein F2Q68_00033711 [Brassica cretica]
MKSTQANLRQTLKDFSDSRKTLSKSSNAFYARRLPTKSSGSLLKSSAQSGTNFVYIFFRSESDFGRLLRKLLEDSRKTLGKLLEDFLGSFQMYSWKSSGSLLKSSAQSGTKE